MFYIVFAKIDGEKFTAFIVEAHFFRDSSPANEEHKDGHSRQLDDAHLPGKLQGTERKSATQRKSAAATSWRSIS